MGGTGTYTGTESQNAWMLSQMKKNGFKDGGKIGKLISQTGEDGIVLARTGEEVLSKDKIDMLADVVENLPAMEDSLQYFRTGTDFAKSDTFAHMSNISQTQEYKRLQDNLHQQRKG